MDYSAILRPLTAQNNSEKANAAKAIVNIDALDTLEVAGKVVKTLAFPVTCGIKNGVPLFFAQLKGGKRFVTTPVMPKDGEGRVMSPLNGSEGFLTLELSENAQLTLADDGKYEFSVRPVFKAWESVEERAAKEAAKTAKKN